MSRRDKLLDKMRHSPTNIRFSDVERLLRYEGFVLFRACRRIIDIEIKRVMRLPIIWVKAVLKEVRSK